MVRMLKILIIMTMLPSCGGQVSNLESSSDAIQGLAIQTTTLRGIQVGDVVSGVVSTGGTAPIAFSVSDGALPEGLKLDAATGVISGTIGASLGGSTYGVTIKVTDSSNLSATKTFTGKIEQGNSILGLAIDNLPQVRVDLRYSYKLPLTGGRSPYKFAITSGALPSGLSLDSADGTISGTPSRSGAGQAYAVSITVTDATGQTLTKTFLGTALASGTVALSVVTTTIPTPAAGYTYMASVFATGGTTPYTYSVSSGSLPSGLSLNASTGVITGTVAASARLQSYLFFITVTDANASTASQTFSGTVSSYATSLTPTALSNATPAANYSATFTTVGGTAPYTYSVTSGSLPSGLSLNSGSGNISGYVAASEAGLTKSFTIASSDANGVTATAAVTLATSAFTIAISTSSLANASEGSAYNNSGVSLAASGGTGPYTYEVSGSLPTGVGLTSSGTFFGTPAAGTGAVSSGTTYTIYVTARDSLGMPSAQVTLTLAVVVAVPVVDAVTPANAVLGATYSHTVTASGGRAPLTYSLASGSLPTGLSLASSGTISGVATASATCPASQFGVRVQDALGQVSSTSLKCITTTNGVTITSSSFAEVVIGVSYSATLTAAGGSGSYTYSAIGLTATGLSLNASTGAISGFTSAVSDGDFDVYFTATDTSTSLQSPAKLFTLRVRQPLAITAATLPRGATGVSYNAGAGYSLAATGGQTPYTFSIVSGSLPSGLSLSSAGLISGTPASSTAANGGSYSIGVRVTDTYGLTTATTTFPLYVTVPPKIDTLKLPPALLNAAYAFDLARTGGVNQFNGTAIASRLTWSISGLPTGLSYNTTSGRIYGTPTTNAGSPYTITASVTDQHGFTGTKTLSLKVLSAAKTLDVRSARYSDPCAGTTQCTPYGITLSKITGNSQQFAVYARNDLTPRSIQIAKIDSNGRIPTAGGNVTSINVSLPANTGNVGPIRVADLDQDGNLDIIFVDYTTRQLCALWGGNTVNTYGMPSAFSSSSINCFPVPIGADTSNALWAFQVASNLRPDSTNYGKQDVIITMTAAGPSPTGTGSSVYILLNTCSLNGACTSAAARATIFAGYANIVGNTTSGSAVITSVASTAGVVAGMPIVGVGIPTGATVASFVANTSITISANATATNSSVKLGLVSGATVTGNSTSGSATITSVASTAGITPGQAITGTGIPVGSSVVSVVTNTSVTISQNLTATNTGVTFTITGPTYHTPFLTNGQGLYFVYNIAYGFFLGTAPNPPTTYATGVNSCPAIVFGGLQRNNTNASWIYFMRQQWSGSQCQGDFTLHAASDEYNLFNVNGAQPGGMAVADFNNDGVADVAIPTQTGVMAASASLKVIMPTGNGTIMSGATIQSPQVQTRGTLTTGVSKAAPYCIDGSSSCSYPSLAVVCNREINLGASGTYGCLSILPNQCSTPGCSAPFEPSTPSARIDYPAPLGIAEDIMIAPLISTSNLTPTGTTTNGSPTISSVSSTTGVQVGQPVSGTGIPAFAYVTAVGAGTITMNINAIASNTVTLTIPAVPTRSDIAFGGYDFNAPYFMTYARNGSSTTDPFKAAKMLDSAPASYLQSVEVGTMKLVDANNDGVLDLYGFGYTQGIVTTHLSGTNGSQTLSLGANLPANYLASNSDDGCPATSSQCFPDPVFNNMGVNMGAPSGAHYQTTMDVADFNNDNVADVVAAGFTSRGVAVGLTSNDGSGEITTSTQVDVGSGADLRPTGVITADLDQDGIADIAVIGQNRSGTTTGFASWLKGNGDGTFQAAVSIDQILNGCTDPRSIAAVDLDSDGRPELAVMCLLNQNLWISRRHSDGTWILQTGSTIVASPGTNGTIIEFGRLTTATSTGVDLVVGGLDAAKSLLIINAVSVSVSNTATGAFTVNSSPGTYLALNGSPGDVAIGDFDHDGQGDLAITMQNNTSNQTGGAIYICRTTSAGACTPYGFGMEGVNATGIVVGDLNNDDLPDILYGNRGASRLISRTITRILNISQ